MIRRLLRAALPAASLLVLVVAGSARADDAPGQKTYALARKSAWRVGDVVTTTTVEAETKKTKETKETLAGDPEAPERVVETKTTAVAVSQCLAAADDGAWTKMLVYVKEWTRTSGDKRDESLKGARVEVASQGREGRWVLAGNSPKPSREGAEWLDRHFGAKSTDEGSLVKALLPKDPVSVGATWDGDAVLLFATSALGSVADPAKSTVKGTLRSVDATSARVGVEISLSLTSLPGLPSGMVAPWSKGGTYLATAVLTLDTQGSPVLSAMTRKGHLDGDAALEAPKGRIRLSISIDATAETRIEKGGEIPEPPPAPETPVAKPPEGGGEPIPK